LKSHSHIKTNNIKKHWQMLYNPVVFITISDYSIHVSDNRKLNVATLVHNVHFLKQVTSDYSCSSTWQAYICDLFLTSVLPALSCRHLLIQIRPSVRHLVLTTAAQVTHCLFDIVQITSFCSQFRKFARHHVCTISSWEINFQWKLIERHKYKYKTWNSVS
jgi:hypothetical protein